jgi:hypothetical protein
VFLNVVQQGNDPAVSFRKVLVSIAHEEEVDTIAVNEASLDKRRVLTRGIDVLLRFYFTAELTRRGFPTVGWGSPFLQVMGVCHPIIYMFGSSPLPSCGGAF